MEEANGKARGSSRPKAAGPPAQLVGAARESTGDQGSAYRALRRKYLVLEEESSALDRELKEVEAAVVALHRNKAALLDQLVVMEGLVDRPHRGK